MRLSLAGRFLLIVFTVTFVPLVGLSVWLVVGTRRSGEALLRGRLESSLTQAAEEMGRKWLPVRSALMNVVEDSALQRVLQSGSDEERIALTVPASQLTPLRTAVQALTIRGERAVQTWLLELDSTGGARMVRTDSKATPAEADGLMVDLPIWFGGTTQQIGEAQARLRTDVLVPVEAGIASATGGVFGVINRASGYVVMSLPFEPELASRSRFDWMGAEWLTAHRSIEEPFVDLIAAAPVSPFTLPFQQAAQRGLLTLVVVAGVGFIMTALLTKRLTHSLVQLAEGADAVAAGDLDRQVQVSTQDEVGRLARAFNTMTESLRRTLAELSQRQAVAAVGEFAAALAHEIRNPLSAIRLNLQHVQERLAADASLQEPVNQSLRDIQRLENTVAGALRVARTGRMRLEPVDLQLPIQAAIRAAMPEIERRKLRFLCNGPAEGVRLRANAAALEQVFLNLLINAVQATEPGGDVGVEAGSDGSTATVTVWDTGHGFTDEARARAFEPFFSTKSEGSGLGLSVARRIIAAHGGTIELMSEPVSGTRVHVRLPLSGNGSTHGA